MARTNVGKPQYKRPERKSAARKSVEIQAGNRTRQILLDADTRGGITYRLRMYGYVARTYGKRKSTVWVAIK